MKWLLIVLAVVAVAALVWGASELHFRSCVTAAEARTPVTAVQRPNPYGAGSGPVQVVTGRAERKAAVNGCSHLPF